jgi:hypothetical protein
VYPVSGKVAMSFVGDLSADEREEGLNRDEDILILPDASEQRPGKYFVHVN